VGKSIAVLPFANMSADKENDFLADGIHEDVLTSLAKIRDLKVISRTSVFAYRDTAARNLKKIAADLGVAVVLEGSVRRSGSKVRVTAQLIDARTDEHLWAENYDGDTGDVFALQAKLAQQIAAALGIKIPDAGCEKKGRVTVNMTAQAKTKLMQGGPASRRVRDLLIKEGIERGDCNTKRRGCGKGKKAA
jgi:TolB-like protein